jgi:hypothetical protein
MVRRRLRRWLHGLIEYDALERRKKGLALFFLIGLAALITLGYLGFDSSAAASLWFFILIRLLIAFFIAWLVLPLIWFFRRRMGMGKTPAGLLFIALTLALTILFFVALERAATT